MIQIRSADGTVVPVKDGQFVEIVADDGAIGMVFFKVPGMVIQVSPGTADAQRYEDMFRSVGVRFNKNLIHRR